VYETTTWRRGLPIAGLLMDALAELDREFASGAHGAIDGMHVTIGDRVVYSAAYARDYTKLLAGRGGTPGAYNYYDSAWHPFLPGSRLHTMQSVSKSVTSALVGIAIRRGEIAGVDMPVAPCFAGYTQDSDSRRDALTLRDLLTMTAGIAWDETTLPYTDPSNTCAAMEASEDWVAFVLRRPMACAPGTRFVYSSGVTMLLAHVLERATQMRLDEYAARYLFAPIGVAASRWKKTPTGLVDAEGGLYLALEDLARFGQLYARDGVWNGVRLLPEGWVDESLARVVDVPDERNLQYGYQWWRVPAPDGSHVPAALGFGGQRLVVLREHGLVGAFTGWNIDQPSLSTAIVVERLLRAVGERSSALA